MCSIGAERLLRSWTAVRVPIVCLAARAVETHPARRQNRMFGNTSTASGRMQRVLVIGSGGSGKTTFSLQLSDATGLPVIHLDQHYWNPGWIPTPDDEWSATVRALCGAERWIMDGNYGGTLDTRVDAADAIVFLDTPRLTCIARVLRRRIAFRGRSRPSLPEDCPERITLGFLHWLWSYPSRRRPTILATLESLRHSKGVHILRSDRERRDLIAALHRGVA